MEKGEREKKEAWRKKQDLKTFSSSFLHLSFSP